MIFLKSITQCFKPYEGLDKHANMCKTYVCLGIKLCCNYSRKMSVGLQVAVRLEFLLLDISHSGCELAEKYTFMI